MQCRKLPDPADPAKININRLAQVHSEIEHLAYCLLLKIRFGRPSRILPLLFTSLIILNIIIILVRRGAPGPVRSLKYNKYSYTHANIIVI